MASSTKQRSTKGSKDCRPVPIIVDHRLYYVRAIAVHLHALPPSDVGNVLGNLTLRQRLSWQTTPMTAEQTAQFHGQMFSYNIWTGQERGYAASSAR